MSGAVSEESVGDLPREKKNWDLRTRFGNLATMTGASRTLEIFRFREYIRQNAVKRGLAVNPEACRYSSASPAIQLDSAPQRLSRLIR